MGERVVDKYARRRFAIQKEEADFKERGGLKTRAVAQYPRSD